jgi:hypothetical protein
LGRSFGVEISFKDASSSDFVQFFAPQHRVEALDGRDAHLAHRIYTSASQVLHVVEFGELASVVGRGVLLELLAVRPWVNDDTDLCA